MQQVQVVTQCNSLHLHVLKQTDSGTLWTGWWRQPKTKYYPHMKKNSMKNETNVFSHCRSDLSCNPDYVPALMMMMDYGFIPAPQPYTSGLVLPTQWGSVLVCLLHHFRTMSYCMYAGCCFKWQSKVFFTVVGSSWKLWTTLKAWLYIKLLLLGYSYDAFTRGWKHMNPVCQRDNSRIFKSACLVCAKLPGIILSVSCSP